MWHKLGGILSLLLLAVFFGGGWAPPAWAEPPSVAVILPKTPAHLTTIYSAFQAKFAELTAGRPAPRFYLQNPNDDYLSLRNSARKAIALNADLVLAFGTPAALAAKAETFETPVLFVDVVEPEALGLVTHNRQDSQLATGIQGNAPLPTLFKLLRDLTDTLKLAIMVDGDHTDKQLAAIFREAAARRGLETVIINVKEKTPAAVLREVAGSNAHALFFFEDEDHHLAVLRLALAERLPAVSIVPEMAEHGALLVLENSPEEQGEVLAEMTVRVLDGDYPEAIPMMKPRRTGVVINLKSARQSGLQVPFEILSQASRIIR